MPTALILDFGIDLQHDLVHNPDCFVASFSLIRECIVSEIGETMERVLSELGHKVEVGRRVEDGALVARISPLDVDGPHTEVVIPTGELVKNNSRMRERLASQAVDGMVN